MPIKQASVFSSKQEPTELGGVPVATVEAIIEDIFPGITIQEVAEALADGPIRSVDDITRYKVDMGIEDDSKNINIIDVIIAVADVAYSKTVSDNNPYYKDLTAGNRLINSVYKQCEKDDRGQGVHKGMGRVMQVIDNTFHHYLLHCVITYYPKYKR